MKIKLRHLLALVLIILISVNFSGSGDTDDNLDCDGCSDTSDSDSDDSCSNETSEDYDDSSDTFDCAGCDSSNDTTTTTTTSSTDNRAPRVQMAQSTVYATNGQLVTLTASTSDADGDFLKYKWMQITGLPEVLLTGKATTNCSFIAPARKTVLTFQLLADDGEDEGRALCTVYVGY